MHVTVTSPTQSYSAPPLLAGAALLAAASSCLKDRATTWCILPPSKTTLGFTQRHMELRHSRTNWPSIGMEKAFFNSQWIAAASELMKRIVEYGIAMNQNEARANQKSKQPSQNESKTR